MTTDKKEFKLQTDVGTSGKMTFRVKNVLNYIGMAPARQKKWIQKNAAKLIRVNGEYWGEKEVFPVSFKPPVIEKEIIAKEPEPAKNENELPSFYEEPLSLFNDNDSP